MIYVLYVLLLIWTLMVIHQLKTISLKHFFPSLFSSVKHNALEHEDLLTLFEKFDYKHEEGVCHGFTLTWAQEAALGFDFQFYNRLNLIKREKETLPNTLSVITEKIKLNQILSRRDQKRNEIRPFLEAICLAQSPEEYSEFYAKNVQQSDIDTIYKLIQLNLCRNQDKVKNLFSRTFSFATVNDTCHFINKLNDLLSAKNHVVVVCSSEEHTVGFKKLTDNNWLFLDINHLYEQSEENPYQILNSGTLVNHLYQSLFETSNELVIHCSFIAKAGQRKLQPRLQSLKGLYPVYEKTSYIQNCRGYGLLSLAVQNDDRDVVREILSSHKSSQISQSELENALFYAAACNRISIMSQLAKIPDMNLNSPCNQDNSALDVACMYANHQIVDLLLHEANIQVNRQDVKGKTPLMKACKSSYTHNKPEIFRLLLAAGADVELTNDKGENASAIATKYQNQTALKILLSYQPKQSPKTCSFHTPDAFFGKKLATETTISYLKHNFFDKTDKSLSESADELGVLTEHSKIN